MTVGAKSKQICFENYQTLAEVFSENNQSEGARSSAINRYSKNLNLDPFFLQIIGISDIIVGDDFTIDWSLPFSNYENLSDYKTLFCLSFAKDNEGNSFHIYDARKDQSPIVFKSHDSEVLVVVAQNLCEFIHALQKFSSERSAGTIDRWFETEIYNHIKKITEVTHDYMNANHLKGMTFDSKANSIQINLSNAEVGAGVSLSFFGDLTRLRRNLKSRSISLLKPSDEEVKKYNKEKNQVRLALIGVPFAFFVYFLFDAFLDKIPLLSAIFIVPFMTFIASIITLFLFGGFYSIYLKLFKS